MCGDVNCEAQKAAIAAVCPAPALIPPHSHPHTTTTTTTPSQMPPRVRLRPPSLRPPSLRRTYSTLPPLPPSSGAVQLSTTRRLISIHGPDAAHFLQGLTTINIPPLTTTGAYSAFLTPHVRFPPLPPPQPDPALMYSKQGRVLFDVFIYPANRSAAWRAALTPADHAPDDPGFFIECDAASAPRLLEHLARYKLRSKFTARLAPSWSAWSIWGTTPPSLLDAITAADSRAPGFATRVLLPGAAEPSPAIPRCSETTYRVRRILHGVPEGQREIAHGAALPAESCIDYMRGIDFRKGCYVGQELTIRTHHRGVVRKRILPVQLYPLGTAPPERLRYEQTLLVPRVPAELLVRGRAAGRWLGGVGNVGLALCRLESVNGDVDVDVDVSVEGVGVRAFVPEWHAVRAKEREEERA